MSNTERRNASRTPSVSTTSSNGHANGGAWKEAEIPHDEFAEAAVLGSVMIDPEVWPAVARMLTPEDFWRAHHRLIFRAMGDVVARGDTIDPITLYDELSSQGRLEEVGGISTVTALDRVVPVSHDVEQYARVVLRHALRRLHLRMGEAHVAISQTDDPKWRRVLSDIETRMAEIRSRLGNEARGETPKRERFRLISVAEVKHMPPIPWLLGNILPAGALSVLFGEYASAKSFLALDWALSVATGRYWHGHVVQPGPVVYIAGEGIDGMGPRIRAWELRTGTQTEECDFHFIGEAPQLLNADDMEEVRGVLRTMPVPPALIINDTLSRSMAGADENQQKEMSLAILRCDELRREFGCHVMLIHHKPHGSDRERGSTVLPGAVDTRIEMARQTDGTIHLTTHKQKNAAEYPSKQQPMRFKLDVVALDEEAKETSCVLAQVAQSATTGAERLTASQLAALLALYNDPAATRAGVTSSEWERLTGRPHQTYHDARNALMHAGFVSRLPSGVYIITPNGVRLVRSEYENGTTGPDQDSA